VAAAWQQLLMTEYQPLSGVIEQEAQSEQTKPLMLGGQVVMLPFPLIRYPREVIPDASTTTYGRKEPQDGANVPRIRAERALVKDWRPLRVTFPWERQCQL
jgi:hypothetical protein